jgi:hypothetical protein
MSDQWLQQLAPAHAPPPPGWWPFAMGWWLLTGLLVLIVLVVGTRWRSPPRKVKKAALRELRSIESSGAGVVETARAIESLLRRYAIATLGVPHVGRLSGKAWVELLSRHRSGFDAAMGHSLLRAAFGLPEMDHRAQWLSAARGFVRRSSRRPQSDDP